MKTLKLHEIIELNEDGKEILIECLLPYKRSLAVLMPNAILMVTMVSNAVQYGKIVDLYGFEEEIESYLNNCDFDNEEDKENERELINFQSIPLSKL